MRFIVAIVMFLSFACAYAQEDSSYVDLSTGKYKLMDASGDTLGADERQARQRQRSINALRQLKESGAIVVRLKTNSKSVDAYRAAGRNDVADRMVKERKVMNEKIYDAFTKIVTFCPTYFIYAHDSKALAEGKQGLFLNADLEYDKKIVMKDTFYVVVEYGSAQGNGYTVDGYSGNVQTGRYRTDRFMGDNKVNGYQTTGVSEGALVFLDKNYVQYVDPFPYCEGVYLENYNAAATAINRQLYRAYNRLVTVLDMRKEMKKSRNDLRQRVREAQ